MKPNSENSLAPLARAAFAVGLTRYGVFFSQLRLFLARIERGFEVSESDWLNLAEYALNPGARSDAANRSD